MEEFSLDGVNNDYYTKLWSHSELMPCHAWPIWSLLKREMAPGRRPLELGPGVRPRIPVKGSWFVEISGPAKRCLEKHGGIVLAPEDKLEKNFFDVVCAFEVLEHIKDDSLMLKNLFFSMRRGGRLFISVPLFKKYWTEWDRMVGHYRRYSPIGLEDLLVKAGFEIELYAEATMARAYTGKISQKLAKVFFTAFPGFSLRMEGRILRVLCWYERNFNKLKWRSGSLAKIPSGWAGVYLVAKKAGVARNPAIAF